MAGVGAVDLMFAAGASQTSGQMLGPGTTTAPVGGSFDDAFWSTNNGNFYAVGASSGSNNTYLVRFPYNGSFGAPSGYAQLHRSGGGAVVASSPVTEFLTASTQANKDFVYVGGAGGTGSRGRTDAGAVERALPAAATRPFATTGSRSRVIFSQRRASSAVTVRPARVGLSPELLTAGL